MNHHPSTEVWYRQAAQNVLDTAQVPDLYGPTHHGTTSAALMYSGTEGQLIVMVGTNVGGRLIDTCPPPRKADDVTQWKKARDRVASLFTAAGFPTPRPTRLGLVIQVPDHLGSPACVQLEPTGLGRYTARIDGHPDLVAEIDGHLQVPTSSGYTLTSTRGRHRGSFATEHRAARAFAEDCGFGPHITITT